MNRKLLIEKYIQPTYYSDSGTAIWLKENNIPYIPENVNMESIDIINYFLTDLTRCLYIGTPIDVEEAYKYNIHGKKKTSNRKR